MNDSRRNFIKNSTIGAIGALSFPTILPSTVFGRDSPSNRINIAIIGCGRQSVNLNIPQLGKSNLAQIVATCDVDAWRLNNAKQQVNNLYSEQKGISYKGCATYNDFREVL